MAFVHGKGSKVTIGGDDLSAFANNVEFSRGADTHDVTTFGKNSKVFAGGLKEGTCTVEGVYDNTADTGPGAVLRPLLGTEAVLIWQPEGTGTGKPTFTVDAVVSSYVETAPVADMVTWSCELQLSDDVAETAQV